MTSSDSKPCLLSQHPYKSDCMIVVWLFFMTPWHDQILTQMYFVLLHVFLLASGEPYSTERTPKRPKRLILALSKPLASRWHQRLQSVLCHKGSLILRPNVNKLLLLVVVSSCDSQRIKALPHSPTLIHWLFSQMSGLLFSMLQRRGLWEYPNHNSELQQFINIQHRWTNVFKISLPSFAHSPESPVDRYQNRWELHPRLGKRGGARCHSMETLQIDTKTLYK